MEVILYFAGGTVSSFEKGNATCLFPVFRTSCMLSPILPRSLTVLSNNVFHNILSSLKGNLARGPKPTWGGQVFCNLGGFLGFQVLFTTFISHFSFRKMNLCLIREGRHNTEIQKFCFLHITHHTSNLPFFDLLP